MKSKMNGSDSFSSAVFIGSSLVCSLGLNVQTACAAIRAGIVRTSNVDTFIVGNLDDSGGATVHSVPVITHGMEGNARLLRLLQAAFEALLIQHPEAPWENAQTAFYLSVPDPDRIHTGHALIPDESLRNEEIKRYENIQADRTAQVDVKGQTQQLLHRAATLAGWMSPVVLQHISTSGNTGVAELIGMADRDLGAGVVELAIVGGVDSWIDEPLLLWLERRQRLKSPSMPVGFSPGEASGFLLMQSTSRAKVVGAPPPARLQSVTVDYETETRLEAKISLGAALTRVLSHTAERACWSVKDRPWLIVDHNGEPYRAMEWGHALNRLVEGQPVFQNPDLWYPVISVGDTGAATGIIQANMAFQAFIRDYAPAIQAVLTSSSDAGQRACVLISSDKGT